MSRRRSRLKNSPIQCVFVQLSSAFTPVQERHPGAGRDVNSHLLRKFRDDGGSGLLRNVALVVPASAGTTLPLISLR